MYGAHWLSVGPQQDVNILKDKFFYQLTSDKNLRSILDF